MMTEWQRIEPTEEMKTVVEFVKSQGVINWCVGDRMSWNRAESPRSVIGKITVFRDPVLLSSTTKLNVSAIRFSVDNTTEPPYEFLFEPVTQTYLTQTT